MIFLDYKSDYLKIHFTEYQWIDSKYNHHRIYELEKYNFEELIFIFLGIK